MIKKSLCIPAFVGLAFLTNACATGPTKVEPAPAQESDRSWRKILQVEDRFAVFILEPGRPVTEDGIAHIELSYVYKPNEVFWEAEVVDWQHYRDMVIDCSEQSVILGPRFRYGPTGQLLYSDDLQDRGPIGSGTATEFAAAARCDGVFSEEFVSIPDGPDWRDAARAHLIADWDKEAI